MPDPDYERLEAAAERLRKMALQIHTQAYYVQRQVAELRDQQLRAEREKAPDHDGRGPAVHS